MSQRAQLIRNEAQTLAHMSIQVYQQRGEGREVDLTLQSGRKVGFSI